MKTFNRFHLAFRNIIFGVFLKGYQTLLPFFMRTLLIYTLGMEYVGLNGLFTSVLQILNLAELGISQAMTYAMYRPIAEDDSDKICKLLGLYKKYYFYIGLAVGIIGLAFLPFLQSLISSDVPADLNIYVLYLLYLASTVISYWMFSYKGSLLEAHQRNDIISKIQIINLTIQSVLQIIVLIMWKNYYLYIIIQVLVQILNQCLIQIYTKKNYPYCYPKKETDYSYKALVTSNIRDLAFAKFGYVVLTSSDTVIISSFLGLSVLAIYQNYYYLITAIIGFISTLMYGIIASIGNSIVTETKEKNYDDFKTLTFIISWITAICTCCFLCMFQPFMELWVGAKYLFPFNMVILFCIYFYIYEFNQLFNVYKDAAGLWHHDRFRPLITSLCNLIMNILLVNVIGIEGVLLSTVLSILIVGMPWLIHNIFTYLFKRNMNDYLFTIAQYVLVVLISCILSHNISMLCNVNLYFSLIIRLFIAVSIPSILYLVLFHKTTPFKNFMVLFFRILRRRH